MTLKTKKEMLIEIMKLQGGTPKPESYGFKYLIKNNDSTQLAERLEALGGTRWKN